MYKTRKENREYLRRWKARHRKEGKCTYCRKKVVPGLTLCPYHRRYYRDLQKRVR
jgi:hypothetical protein